MSTRNYDHIIIEMPEFNLFILKQLFVRSYNLAIVIPAKRIQ